MENTENYKKLYEELLNENEQLKKRLKKYTAPERNAKFYENHKEEIIEKVKEYQKQTGYKSIPTPEQKKEYNKRAYQKRKELMKLENKIKK